MTIRHVPVLIIGSGPAGYTAAIYAARAMLKPVLIAGLQQGGQLMITTDVENYPGFADPIQGPWLMNEMLKQAEHVGTEVVNDIVTEVNLDVRPFRLNTDSGTEYTADALIIATGAQAKWLGIPSEQHFMGFGVSACATCDGFFYRGKDVVVVGGGNSAVEEALYLSNIAKSVTVVHRRGEFRAERILQERLFRKENVKVMWDSAIESINGIHAKLPTPASVTGVTLRNTRTGALSELAADGVFVAIGHAPAVELFVGKLKQKPNGYLWTAPDSTKTDVPGVFAAGDVTDDIYRQAVTAAGLGCMAALEAEKYLAEMEMHREAAE
jgi:thioredoxin reductase (NADPH)